MYITVNSTSVVIENVIDIYELIYVCLESR